MGTANVSELPYIDALTADTSRKPVQSTRRTVVSSSVSGISPSRISAFLAAILPTSL